MTNSDFRVPSTSRNRVRVATLLDILEAYRKFEGTSCEEGTSFEIEFVPDFKSPSLAGVMNKTSRQLVDEARSEFEKRCMQNPREYQPAIDGFYVRLGKHFGPVSYETIERARATLASSSDSLMIDDINRMTLREFNKEWDRLVCTKTVVLTSGEIRARYDLTARQIRLWAVDDRKPFIKRVREQRKYVLDPDHPELVAKKRSPSDKK